MKCFERLVMRQIKDLLPLSLDPMQFAYRPNFSMNDAISKTLHLSSQVKSIAECGVRVRDRGERDSNDLLSCPHYPLQGLVI
ncbi:hypothetical protein QTP86_027626 [Hemibagrus guttatus]|nr:hypothetical protein QTP86_027626 [Hemibagrus guttatus]